MTKRGCECVGIDLGTTYSALAYMDSQSTPRIVSDAGGQNVVPSAIYFDDSGVVVGDLALQYAKVAAKQVVQFVKIRMGDDWHFEYGGKHHTPESLSAIILKHLVNEAEPQIGPIRRAVITVPAYFTERRRRATHQAGEIAGLEVLGTLNEPMAATLAYGLFHDDTVQNAVVYDLGGGTFDVTVVQIAPNEICELATCGNRQLGGLDWDGAILDFVAEGFRLAHGSDPRDDLQAAQDLAIECERAKRTLSRLERASIRFQALGQQHTAEITRSEFEERTAHLVQATRLTVEMALEDAGLSWGDVSRLVLVGGTTQIPAVRRMLGELSGMELDVGVHPIMSVALGAAIYGQMLEVGLPMSVIHRIDAEDVVPDPAPVQDGSRQELEHGGLPPVSVFEQPVVEAEEQRSTDEQSDAEALSLSAPSIHFVTAHGVGVKTRRGANWANTVLIPRNTRVPARAKKKFLTTAAGEAGQHVLIEITQGDAADIELAEILGVGRIDGFEENEPPGQPVEVIMDFDTTGRLHIQAVYLKTGHEMELSLDVAGGLEAHEVEEFRERLRKEKFLSVFNPDEALAGLEHDLEEDEEEEEEEEEAT